ncbi:hypothetical protein M758_12G088600 [Ceratodon purpureus]|nr:hypothetical protein M758_12G088600 [Ceratodon purpureus]
MITMEFSSRLISQDVIGVQHSQHGQHRRRVLLVQLKRICVRHTLHSVAYQLYIIRPLSWRKNQWRK